MPAPWIFVYKDNPVAGNTSGTQCSSETGITPIIVGPLNASNAEESGHIKLAIRTDAGYQTTGNTVIALTGTTATKWALAPDNGSVAGAWGAYGNSLTISTTITAVNTIFWAKAKTSVDETPSNDATVKFSVTATISAV